MVKTALIFLANGNEEMETVITADVLRRAGIDVTLADVNGSNVVVCSRNVKIVPDVALDSVLDRTFDAVIMPGGLKGAEAFATSANVGKVLQKHYDGKKLVAAICASSTALFAHRIAFGKEITSYPSFKEKLAANYVYKEDRVVRDDNLITSRGPGTTFEFALKIVEYLEGAEKVTEISAPMLVNL